MARKHWSRSIVIASIQKIHKSGGKLNSDYSQKRRRKLYLAACAYCGSWKEAIKAAGISYNAVKLSAPRSRKWNKEKIVLQIRTLHLSGRPINSNYVQLHSMITNRLYHAAVKYFGSWKQAVEAAGLDYALVRVVPTFRSWNKIAVAKAIKDRLERGLVLNGSVVSEEDRGLYLAAKRHIGGWGKALRFAGIDPRTITDPRKIWTVERVREEVLSLHGKGIPLNNGSLRRRGQTRLMSAAQKLFGSWRKAIRFSGLRYADVKKIRIKWWTPKRILYSIRRLEKAGIKLSSKSIQISRGGLFQAAVTHFGSWSGAVEAAGFDYSEHSTIWSSKAWVRKLTTDDLDKIDRQSLEMSKIRKRRE